MNTAQISNHMMQMWWRCRPRLPLVLPRLKPVLSVSGSPGGRSWKRWQEHLTVHSSSLKRKLSTSASLDGLPCHSNGSTAGRTPRNAFTLRPAAAATAAVERAHLPNGIPSGVAPDLSPKRRRLSRHHVQADGGVPPPSPDVSGVTATPSAPSPGELGKGSGQQQKGPNGRVSAQEQRSEAGPVNSDSAGGYFRTPHASHVPTELHCTCHLSELTAHRMLSSY